MSDKRKKFEEFATRRTNNAINQIRLIGKLANKSAYDYNEDDINKITSALKREIENIRNKFLSTQKNKESDFSL
jgi:hypothetical protein